MLITKRKSYETITSSKSVSDSKREAEEHIKAAIDCLGKIAASDDVAKDNIANLGVVLLDLQD